MPVETSYEVKSRVKDFLGHIICTAPLTGEGSVLLCTHQAIVEMILEELHGTAPDATYPMGLVSPVCEYNN